MGQQIGSPTAKWHPIEPTRCELQVKDAGRPAAWSPRLSHELLEEFFREAVLEATPELAKVDIGDQSQWILGPCGSTMERVNLAAWV